MKNNNTTLSEQYTLSEQFQNTMKNNSEAKSILLTHIYKEIWLMKYKTEPSVNYQIDLLYHGGIVVLHFRTVLTGWYCCSLF
jgi:hypothetical protein